jgi:hypothetical protein
MVVGGRGSGWSSWGWHWIRRVDRNAYDAINLTTLDMGNGVATINSMVDGVFARGCNENAVITVGHGSTSMVHGVHVSSSMVSIPHNALGRREEVVVMVIII